jgi:hypothetical protein
VFLFRDRKVRANKIPQRSQALFTTYDLSATGTEGQRLASIMRAFVAGIRDELATPGRIAELATFYTQRWQAADWPYDRTYRLSPAQYTRLLARAPACWEPIAVYLFSVGGVAESLPPDPAGTPFVTFGSSSWGVSAFGSQNGGTYVHADPHGGIATWHVVRVKSTATDGVDFGGFILEGTPFILGGFGSWVAWTTHFVNGMDGLDQMEYLANFNSSEPWYLDETSTSCSARPLRSETLQIPVFGSGVDVSTQWYLDSASGAPGDSPMWAAKIETVTGPCGETHKIRATRPAGLENGISPAEKWDTPRMIWRMLRATSAEDLLARAFGETLSSYPIGFTIGSDYDPSLTPPPTNGPQPLGMPQQPPGGGNGQRYPQLVYLPFGRIPRRPDDLMLHNFYVSTIPMSGTQDTRKWTTENGRMFYTIDRFPTHRSHQTYSGQNTKFLAGCNSSPQWCFGRNDPFPAVTANELAGVLEPSYGIGVGGTFYQRPAWYTDFPSYANWGALYTPATITASYEGSYAAVGLGGTYGALTVRQEWAIRKLKEKYDPLPRSLTETELRDLADDRQDPHPWYLARLIHPTLQVSWFQDVVNIQGLNNAQRNLALELKAWAEAGADLEENTNRPAKWHLFWYFFKESPTSKLNTQSPAEVRDFLYNVPSFHAFRFPGQYTYVRDAAKDALTAANQAVNAVPTPPGPSGLRLRDMLYVRVPFTTTTYGTVGFLETLKNVWTGPWTSIPGNGMPRRLVGPGSRNPMLMRLRQSAAEPHSVYLMNCGMAADLPTLPELDFNRYRSSIMNWAAGTDYLMPMTEAALLAEGAPVYNSAYVPLTTCP